MRKNSKILLIVLLTLLAFPTLTNKIRHSFLLLFTTKSAPVIVLDPGHGTRRSSVGAYREAGLNLAVALKMERILKVNGYKVYLTHRRLGQNLGARSMKGDNIIRARFANSKKANLFFRIHCDEPRGVSAVYFPRYHPNKWLAKRSLVISRNIWKEMKKLPNPSHKGGIRGDEATGSGSGSSSRLLVSSRYAKVPAVLVEMITVSRKPRRWLEKPANQINMAITLSRGIHKTFKPNVKFIDPYHTPGY